MVMTINQSVLASIYAFRIIFSDYSISLATSRRLCFSNKFKFFATTRKHTREAQLVVSIVYFSPFDISTIYARGLKYINIWIPICPVYFRNRSISIGKVVVVIIIREALRNKHYEPCHVILYVKSTSLIPSIIWWIEDDTPMKSETKWFAVRATGLPVNCGIRSKPSFSEFFVLFPRTGHLVFEIPIELAWQIRYIKWFQNIFR